MVVDAGAVGVGVADARVEGALFEDAATVIAAVVAFPVQLAADS